MIVTGVDTVTCPICTGIAFGSWASGGPTVSDACTDAALGLLLVSLTVTPPAGATPVSCSCMNSLSPLKGAARVRVRLAGTDGAELTTKDAAGDHAVTAAVVGLLSPWSERTRQNVWPATRLTSSCVGAVKNGKSSSIDVNAALRETSTSYPSSCGFGEGEKLSVTGSVTVTPPTGEIGIGGAGRGLL